MRRSDREIIDKKEIIEIIRKCDVCRIVLNDKDYPYIVPLNFGMDIQDGKIVFYFHGADEGKKYDLMRKDNRVTFEMDCSHQLVMNDKKMSCTMKYESVIGRGHGNCIGRGKNEGIASFDETLSSGRLSVWYGNCSKNKCI